MVFWIVFSVIHILATLLLSTQLYYMGRWRFGKITARILKTPVFRSLVQKLRNAVLQSFFKILLCDDELQVILYFIVS